MEKIPNKVRRDRHAAGLSTELGSMTRTCKKRRSLPCVALRLCGQAEAIAVDPTATVKRAAIPKTDGFATWEAEHLRAFERTWSLDSPERLAFALARWTLARRGDLIRFTWQQVRPGDPASPHGYLEWTPRKTARSTGVMVRLPILPELEEVLKRHRPKAAAAIGPILVNLRGRPYSEDSFAHMSRPPSSRPSFRKVTRRTGCAKPASAGCWRPALRPRT